MEPKLAFAYNSSGGNGWLGVGWDINIGYIQRSTKFGLDYTANDYVSVVNGSSELVARSEWGTNYYGAKIEGAMSKYYYNSSSGWVMTAKDGTKYYFGQTTDSREYNANGTFKWLLDEVEDTNGNYMTIAYVRYDGILYPSQIQYTGHSTASASNSVEFILETRTDVANNYTQGVLTKTSMRLNRVEVKNSGNLVRKYVLGYSESPSSKRSLLTSITQHGNSGGTLPPNTFTYDNDGLVGDYNLYDQTTTLSYGSYQKCFTGDANGDGKTDYMCANEVNNYYVLQVALSNGDGTFTTYTQQTNWRLTGGNDHGLIYPGDWNGDGLTDFMAVLLLPIQEMEPYFFLSFSAAISNIDGGYSLSTSQYQYVLPNGPWGNYVPFFPWFDYSTKTFINDVDGDGLSDFTFFTLSSLYTFINNGSGGFNYVNPPTYPGNLTSSSLQYLSTDISGDGKSDFLIIGDYDSDNKVEIYTSISNGDGTFSIAEQNTNTTFYATADNYFLSGNVNGDGYTDLIYAYNYSNYEQVVTFFSKGNGQYEASSPFNTNLVFKPGNQVWYSSEANGDGISDLIYVYYQDHYIRIKTLTSRGDGTYVTNTYQEVMYESYYTWTNSSIFTLSGDVNGDGKADFSSYHANNGKIRFRGGFHTAPIDLLEKIDNPIGGSMEFTYWPSSKWMQRQTYYTVLMPFVTQTLRTIKQDDGRGHQQYTYYGYYGGFYDFPTREFRGFNRTYYNDSPFTYRKWTVFNQGEFDKGMVKVIISYNSSSQVLQRTDNSYSIDTIGASKFPRLYKSTTTVTDPGYPSYSHRTEYVYDSYLNVSQVHRYGAGSGTTPDDVHTYTTYTTYTSPWIVSKPTMVTVQDSSYSIKARKWMDYNGTTGNLETEEVCISDTPSSGCSSRNATQNAVTTFTYYSDGNLHTANDPLNHTTTITYDSTKVYPHTKTNALGQETTTVYDAKFGKLDYLIPPHLQGTSYEFDNTFDQFGRIQTESRPDGGYTAYVYNISGTPASDNQYVQVQEHVVGGAATLDTYQKVLFDGLGRTYKTDTWSGGTHVYTKTEFDGRGRLWREYSSSFQANPPYYTEYAYDCQSRITDIRTPDDKHVTTSYQGLDRIVVDQNDHDTKYSYDTLGRVKTVTDPDYTLTEYSYDVLGNITQVVAAKNQDEENTTTMTYDSMGRKRSMTDPDMGYWTYQYDKAGNLRYQTDAKYQTVEFQYDELNRLEYKIYPDRTVTYTYDDPSIDYSEGALTSVSDPSGSLVKSDVIQGFDVMQRITHSEKSIGPDSVDMASSYDSTGRPYEITYFPGGAQARTFRYSFDGLGNMTSLRDVAAGRNLVEYSNFTALGQHRMAKYPKSGTNNSVITDYSYDAVTNRLAGLVTSKNVNGLPVAIYQDLTYQTYTNKGQLYELVDNLYGITHTYTRDALDRLVSATGVGNGAYNQSYEYDRIGNIKYKSDVGTYLYDDYITKPHAVRSAGGITMQYDDNGNMTQKVSGSVTLDIEYNYDNMPVLVEKGGSDYVKFIYDGNGVRVKKQNLWTGSTTLYFGDAYEVRGSVGIMHLFGAGGQRVVSIRTDGAEHCYHPNHLGSASAITDVNGNLLETIEYFPFGTYRGANQNPNVKYTFTDQEDDDDLGFYNYNARLYDPILGRFLSADTIVPDQYNLQSLNRYSYVLNDPITYTDPSGFEEEKWDPSKDPNLPNFPIELLYLWDTNQYTKEEIIQMYFDYLMPRLGSDYLPTAVAVSVWDGFSYAVVVGAQINNQNVQVQKEKTLHTEVKIGDQIVSSGERNISVPSSTILYTGTITAPLSFPGFLIGASLGGLTGAVFGATIGNMFGIGLSGAYVPSNKQIALGLTGVVGFPLGGGYNVTIAFIEAPQSPSTFATGWGFTGISQLGPIFGPTVIISPGNGKTGAFSFGSRVPASFGVNYNWCIYNCGK